MPSTLPGSVMQIGEFQLDCGRFELRRDGHPLRVERKPMELLILLASREGQLVTREEIAQRLWSHEVFVDTEHGINTAIRKLRYCLRDDPEAPRYIQTVTGKGYRLVAPVSVPPNVLQAATAPAEPPQLQPPNIVPAANTLEPEAPVSPPVERRPIGIAIWLAVPLALVLAAGVFYGARLLMQRHERAAVTIHSLAVLPLDNLSGDPKQDYFADGMTDELTTMLARNSTLRIVSRTSVMQYKKARRPLREIARALGADGIVEGSVARSGGRVHMNLQLIHAAADAHLWADSYDRDADDLALPDEAAQAIAKRLHSSAFVTVPVRYVNPAAHDAYLQGKYLWFSNGMGDSGKYFQKAIEIQPDYAMGWAWLSMYYGGATVAGLLDPRIGMDPMEHSAGRAMQLDPNLAESHQAMAAALAFHRWEFAAADQEILRAISLDPHNAESYLLRSKILIILNRHAEAIDSAKKGMEINPFQKPMELLYFYLSARRYDDAIQEGELRLKDFPAHSTLLSLTTEAYRCRDMYGAAGNAKRRDTSDIATFSFACGGLSIGFATRLHEAAGDPQSAAALRRAYQQAGLHGTVRWQLARREKRSKSSYVSPVELA
ncbi:MAG TPA: winged helix-turn-helix domain-containing protein, partial [Acidobacteriaceae bacterium]|nr:winged helix-turn-helix domain-containing protein [Acidobacteriaceae bacterium]